MTREELSADTLPEYLGNPNLTLYVVPGKTPNWYRFRNTGIGGSECAQALGRNKYRSARELFYNKVGLYEPSKMVNASMLLGTILEDTIKDIWRYDVEGVDAWVDQYLSGKPLREYTNVEGYVVNRKWPYMFASLDGLINPGTIAMTGEILDRHGILEAKTIKSYYANQWENGIPPMYLFQIQMYLMIMELEYAEIILLESHNAVKRWPILKNKAMCDLIEEGLDIFWGGVMLGKPLVKKYHPDEDMILQELTPFQPELDNPEALSEWLSRNAKLQENIAQGSKDELYAASMYNVLNSISRLVDSEKKKHEAVLRIGFDKDECFRKDFKDLGYATLQTRKNTTKTTLGARKVKVPAMDIYNIEFLNTLGNIGKHLRNS